MLHFTVKKTAKAQPICRAQNQMQAQTLYAYIKAYILTRMPAHSKEKDAVSDTSKAAR